MMSVMGKIAHQAIRTLRVAQRETDERARQAMREASRLLDLSHNLEQQLRKLARGSRDDRAGVGS